MMPQFLTSIDHFLVASLVAKYTDATEKGYEINDFVAEAICWAGLEGTTAYDDVDEEFKETYKNLINNEFNGFKILSVGKRCSNN